MTTSTSGSPRPYKPLSPVVRGRQCDELAFMHHAGLLRPVSVEQEAKRVDAAAKTGAPKK